jgi:uncharacterized membrane protein SpoIIM required for sporulation
VSQTKQLIFAANDIPKLAVGILLGVAVFGIFAIGFDQGQLFSLVQGHDAYGSMWMHEFTHDTRHAAGFACH